MYTTEALAKSAADSDFTKITIERGETGPDDVEFDIKFCGICHSDVHIAQNELLPYRETKYPCVPGHELAGVCTKVGENVKNVKVGDKVGVGCIADSCMDCNCCSNGEEQYCQKGMTMTYNTDIKHGHISTGSGYTFGGYSGRITVNGRYAVKIPDSYPLEKAGPVFCAGITTYSPLVRYGAKKGGMKIGVVGIGGLGQMGVQLANAMGNDVTAISTSRNKEEAARNIGAKNFVVSTDPDSMQKNARSLDLIINTVSADHQVSTYLTLLKRHGTMVMLGATNSPQKNFAPLMMYGPVTLTGSIIGGMPETQELIDFCSEKNIEPVIELITGDQLLDVYKNLAGKNDSVKRYVLDVQKSLNM